MEKYYRMDYSEYFSRGFQNLEQNELSKIQGLAPANAPDEADILITNSDTIVENIPNNTRLVIHPNSGYDRFSLEWLKTRDIPVIVGSPIRQIAVSEYYLSAIFQHFSKIPESKNWDNSRQWNRDLISEKSVLILGEGHIGSYLKKALSPICKQVHNHDPFKTPTENEIAPSNYHIIITAFGLNPSTKNFLNSKFLDQCRSDLLLLHASRGKQLVVEDLERFLKKNPAAFAFVDVFPNEPYNYETLNSNNNIFCSSHIAGVYTEIESNLIQFEKEVIESFINLDKVEFLQKYKDQNLNERKDHSFLI